MYMVVLVIIGLSISIIFGSISQQIMEEKGYGKAGFWSGFQHGIFGIAQAKAMPDLKERDNQRALIKALGPAHRDNELLTNGGWRCSKCGAVNAGYVGTCGCGTTKYESEHPQPVVQNVKTTNPAGNISEEKKVDNEYEKIKILKEYKNLLDDGVLTAEEYEQKKKAIMNL